MFVSYCDLCIYCNLAQKLAQVMDRDTLTTSQRGPKGSRRFTESGLLVLVMNPQTTDCYRHFGRYVLYFGSLVAYFDVTCMTRGTLGDDR